MGDAQLWRMLLANGRMSLEPFYRGGWQAIGWVVGETLINFATIVGTLLLASRFNGIGPWSTGDLVFMMGFLLMARGFANVFAGQQVLMISRKIGRGQLDHLLLQPVRLWKALMAEGFSPFDLALTMLVGGVMVGWSATQLDIHIDLLWIAMVIVQVISATLVIISYQYFWGSLAFWAPRGAEEINTASYAVTTSLSGFPLDGVQRGVLYVLLSVIPVGFIAWLPSRSLLDLGANNAASLAVTPLFSLAACSVSVLVFSKGLKHYGKTGSVRYSDFGHRR